jgi:hypothetical protein
MKKFLVERNLPGAENLSIEELRDISRTWSDAANQMGISDIWVHSYIAVDKIYCLHFAESEEVIREHARVSKSPVNIISEIKTIIDPTTGNTLHIP